MVVMCLHNVSSQTPFNLLSGTNQKLYNNLYNTLEICTGAVTGTNPRVSAGIPRERGRILRKTRGNDGNGNDFCGNTAGTGPNFTWNTANSFGNLDRQWTILVLMHCSGLDEC